jgi:hypothetical protein
MFEDKVLILIVEKSATISIFLYFLTIYQDFFNLSFTIYRFPPQIITVTIEIFMVIRPLPTQLKYQN